MKCHRILDSLDSDLEAIVISNVTTSQKLEKILNDLKHEKPGGWDYEDFKMRLPHDCEFYYPYETEIILN